MVQREVGKLLRRAPGTAAYGVAVGARSARVRVCASTARQSPARSSTRCRTSTPCWSRWDRRCAGATGRPLRALVEGAFAHRRKALARPWRSRRRCRRSPTCATAPARRSRGSATPPTRAPSVCRPWSSARSGRRCGERRPARARAGQAESLPVRRPAPRPRRPPRARHGLPAAHARRPRHARAGAVRRAARRGPCPGVPERRGEPRGGARCGVPGPNDWSGPPIRLEIDKRIPIAAGMAGGSADAAAALRLASRAAGIGDDALLREIGVRARRRRSRAGPARPVTGDRRRRAGATGGPRAGVRLLVLPASERLATADVYRDADGLGLARDAADLRDRLRAVAAHAADLPDDLGGQRPRGRPRARCARRSTTRSRRRAAGADARSSAARARPSLGLFADAEPPGAPPCLAGRCPPDPRRAVAPTRRGGGVKPARSSPRRARGVPRAGAGASSSDAADRRRDRRSWARRLQLRVSSSCRTSRSR